MSQGTITFEDGSVLTCSFPPLRPCKGEHKRWVWDIWHLTRSCVKCLTLHPDDEAVDRRAWRTSQLHDRKTDGSGDIMPNPLCPRCQAVTE